MLIPPAQARRIDRLARHGHRFHRYAHHPLCDAYADEVIRIGRRMRVCRGCSATFGGALLGALVAVAFPAFPTGVLLGGATVAALVAAVVIGGRARGTAPASTVAVAPPGSIPTRRTSKLLTRALPAFLAAATALGGARAGTATGWLVSIALLAVVALTVLAYRRRGPDRTPCETCVERSSTLICSGLRPIARREAAFRRVSARILVAPSRPQP